MARCEPRIQFNAREILLRAVQAISGGGHRAGPYAGDRGEVVVVVVQVAPRLAAGRF